MLDAGDLEPWLTEPLEDPLATLPEEERPDDLAEEAEDIPDDLPDDLPDEAEDLPEDLADDFPEDFDDLPLEPLDFADDLEEPLEDLGELLDLEEPPALLSSIISPKLVL